MSRVFRDSDQEGMGIPLEGLRSKSLGDPSRSPETSSLKSDRPLVGRTFQPSPSPLA